MDSADLCSYCFSQLGECPGVGCRDCKRRVHKDCLSKYKGSAPWSYCPCLGSVCLDCWLPSSMPNFGSRRTGSGNGKIPAKIGSGKVVDVSRNKILDKVSKAENLEDVMKDVNCEVERKFVVAARAKEKALRKVVLAKSAVELATSALGLVVRKDDNTGKGSSEAPFVDDAELAFRLHRAINSSPRISKNLRRVNSVSSAVPKAVNCDSDSLGGEGSVCGIINPSGTVSETSVQCRTSIKLNLIIEEGKECLGNNITRTGPTEMGVNGGINARPDAEDYKLELPLKEGEESCSNKLVNSCADASGVDWESQRCQKQDLLRPGLHASDSGTQWVSRCGSYTMMQEKGCINKPDRYFRKYSKRHANLKAVLNSVTKVHREGYLESQASAPGLPVNCSKASETFSDASFQSCAVPVQASASARGSS